MRAALHAARASERQRELDDDQHQKADQEQQGKTTLDARCGLEVLTRAHGQRPGPHALADHDT